MRFTALSIIALVSSAVLTSQPAEGFRAAPRRAALASLRPRRGPAAGAAHFSRAETRLFSSTAGSQLVNASVPSPPALAEVRSITSDAEFLDAMERGKDDLIVVKFYASWCRACKALGPKYKKVAGEYGGPCGAHFYEIEFNGNKDLCKRLDVRVLPYVAFFKGGEGKVEGFACGPSKIGTLRNKLDEYLDDTCDLPLTELRAEHYED